MIENRFEPIKELLQACADELNIECTSVERVLARIAMEKIRERDELAAEVGRLRVAIKSEKERLLKLCKRTLSASEKALYTYGLGVLVNVEDRAAEVLKANP